MAQQHFARLTLANLPHLGQGETVRAFVGKNPDGTFFPTDREDAHLFRSPGAAARAVDKVLRSINAATARRQ